MTAGSRGRTYRIFISSTFRDMHAERDHLVRTVFPELKERCRPRRVNLIDVDLRWGVSEADAQDGKALDICLDEIDSCRPYFVGLLGHRYGWVPLGHAHSITAQEIFHGVLHNDAPRQVVDLPSILAGKLEGKRLSAEQRDCLARCYRWEAEKGKYLLTEDVAPDDLEVIRSVFERYSAYQRDRSFFFFRSEALSRKLAGANPSDYFETEQDNCDKLAAVKQAVKDAGLPWVEYDDIETFGHRVRDILWGRIEAELGQPAEQERSWIEEEAELHELFVADRTRRFIGRCDLLQQMHEFCEGPGQSPLMVITGEPGSGKSALMGRFAEELRQRHPDWLVVPHFVGASPASTNLREMLKRFCTLLSAAAGATEEIPEDINGLLRAFPELLKSAVAQRKIVLVLDAVNQLERTDNAYDMRWLPRALPDNARVVLSTLEGEALQALRARSVKPDEKCVTGLAAKEIRELVADYLKEIRHGFPNPQVEQAFFNKVSAGNPLYILVALEELRVFGQFEQLAKRVARLPESVPALFDQVLERIESDFNPSLVRDCMSYIACGRHGMTAEELQTLLRHHAPQRESNAAKLPDMLWARLYRAFSAYLFQRSGVIDFFHSQLKEAVRQRYLPDETARKAVHRVIADHFETRWREPNARALDELPYQRTKAEDWAGVEQTLTDLHFIEAKCASGMSHHLVADYHDVLDALPEARGEKEKQQRYEERLRSYCLSLITYARGETDHLNIIACTMPGTDEETEQDIGRTTLNRILAFSRFVDSERHNLAKFRNIPGFCLQQAYNFSSVGPVKKVAESMVNSDRKIPLLLRQGRTMLMPNTTAHQDAVLRTLDGRGIGGELVVMTPDGSRAISTSHGNGIAIWDIESGVCLRVLDGNTSGESSWDLIKSVAVTPDGRTAIAAIADGTLSVWDVETGVCPGSLMRDKIYGRRAESVESVALTADGGRAVSNDNKILCVWDIENRVCLRILEGHTERITSVALTADGRRAISGSRDGTLRVWDIETGACLMVLGGHAESVNSVAVTADGRRVISGGSNGILRVWDIEIGVCLRRLEAQTRTISGVAISADGRLAISAAFMGRLHVWDVEASVCIGTIEGAPRPLENNVAMTADGRRAISGSDNGTIWVWDVEALTCLTTPERSDGGMSELLCFDGMRAVLQGWDTRVQVWRAETGVCLGTLEGPTDSVNHVVMTADERRAMSTSWDGALRIWDVETGVCLKTLDEHADDHQSVALTSDGRRALSSQAGSKGKVLRVWDIETGVCLRTLEGHRKFVDSVALAPEGRIVISNDWQTIMVWDVETGDCLRSLKIPWDWACVTVKMTHSGRRIVLVRKCTLTHDWYLHFYDLRAWTCLMTLNVGMEGVCSLTITPDERYIVVVSQDSVLKVWDLETGALGAVCALKGGASSLSRVRPDGGFLVGVVSGEVVDMMLSNLSFDAPIVTPIRAWCYKDSHEPGWWDPDVKVTCPWCTEKFPVVGESLKVIATIGRNANVATSQTACWYLPTEAWDEPRLLSECLHCHSPLRLNPFIVDNRGRW